MSHKKENPYAAAAGTYDNNARAHTPDQRELEGRILLKSNQTMKAIQENWDARGKDDIEEALKYNRQIWMLFYDTALENKDGERPKQLRSNIVNLANFIFKRELDILSEPKKEKFDVLININREIAAGLMVKQPQSPTQTAPAPPPTDQKPTDISG